MKIRQQIFRGVVSGLAMGVALFVFGAILARIFYGPAMAPPGKFEPEQLNPAYFVWTKLVIGVFFGLLFTFFYERLPLSRKIKNAAQGMKGAFFLWLVISLWNLSHPILYESPDYRNVVFWLLYTLSGFLVFGAVLGEFYRRAGEEAAEA
jgi:hypothetical protein